MVDATAYQCPNRFSLSLRSCHVVMTDDLLEWVASASPDIMDGQEDSGTLESL